MIDALAIICSCVGCLYVAWRAAKLDKEIPWFGPASPSEVTKRRYLPAKQARR